MSIRKNIAILAFVGAAVKVVGFDNGLEFGKKPQSSSNTPTILNSDSIRNLSFAEAASAPVAGESLPAPYNSFAP